MNALDSRRESTAGACFLKYFAAYSSRSALTSSSPSTDDRRRGGSQEGRDALFGPVCCDDDVRDFLSSPSFSSFVGGCSSSLRPAIHPFLLSPIDIMLGPSTNERTTPRTSLRVCLPAIIQSSKARTRTTRKSSNRASLLENDESLCPYTFPTATGDVLLEPRIETDDSNDGAQTRRARNFWFA